MNIAVKTSHASTFKVLANDFNMRIIDYLLECPLVTVKDLLIALSEQAGYEIDQTTLSYHLKCLRRRSIVDFSENGARHQYFVTQPEVVESMMELASTLERRKVLIRERRRA